MKFIFAALLYSAIICMRGEGGVRAHVPKRGYVPVYGHVSECPTISNNQLSDSRLSTIEFNSMYIYKFVCKPLLKSAFFGIPVAGRTTTLVTGRPEIGTISCPATHTLKFIKNNVDSKVGSCFKTVQIGL
jgi:hypothetical protein